MDKSVEKQARLLVGPFTLVPIPTVDGHVGQWAIPGGGRVTYTEAIRLATVNGWPRPELVFVDIVRRPVGEP